ncbi:MAG: peroxiredoxin [Solirubrobacteraceae bacterium]
MIERLSILGRPLVRYVAPRHDRPVEVGLPAPDFTLPNKDAQLTQLSSLRGRPVVLYFYPEADTPGCTTQACGVRDRAADYETVNAVVLGVSPDSPKKLRAFADQYGLPFTLLGERIIRPPRSTASGSRSRCIAAATRASERSTFVIGHDGKIEHVFRKVRPAEHDELVLGALAA